MTPEQFCYWLQGYYELTSNSEINSLTHVIIREHLQEVFKKVTPVHEKDFPTIPNQPLPHGVPYEVGKPFKPHAPWTPSWPEKDKIGDVWPPKDTFIC